MSINDAINQAASQGDMTDPSTQAPNIQAPTAPPANTPGVSQAQPQPNQPTQPKPQVQPTQPQQPTAALRPDNQPTPIHRSLFDKIFTGLGGGPRYVTQKGPDGQPVTTEAPTSRGDITKSLLAGVIHGIIAGAAASANAPAGPAGTNTPANFAALGAGYQAGQQNQQQFKNAPQQQYDILQQRKATVLANNLAELKNNMAIDQLHNADWESKEDYYSKTKDVYQPIIDNVKQADQDSGSQLIVDSNLSHQDAMAKLQGHASEYSAVQDGFTTETHSDGRVYHVPTFSLVKIGDVPVNRDALTALAPFDNSVKKLLDTTSDKVTLSTSMLLSLEKNAQAAHAGYEALHQWQNALGVDEKDQMTQSEFNEKYRNNPMLKRQVGDVLTSLGNIGTQSTDHALAQLMASGKANEFVKLIGRSPDQLQQYINDAQDDLIAAQTKAKNIKAMADPAVIANFAKDAKTNYPNLTTGQITSVVTGLGKNPSQAELDRAENKLQAISNSNHQAKLADQGLDEKQQKMLFDYGVAGNTHLTLDNAPEEMLVNQRTGNPIPNKSLSAVKASQSEVNRAQFAGSTLHLIGALRKLQDSGNLPNVPLAGGITNSVLSKAGITGEDAQKALTEISLLQSAATGAHVGGRFSTQVLDKMNKLLSLNMNDAQFRGSLDAIEDTMQGYKDNGGRFTVAEWRQLTPADRQRLMGGESNQINGAAQRPAPPPGFAPVVPVSQ